MDISNTPITNVKKDGSIEVLRHIQFECNHCTNCCKLNNIPVTEKDVIRMVENGIEADQAVANFSPILIASKDIDNGLIKAYMLRRKPFVKECAFLEENKLCRIHEFKPLACQLYPFSVRRIEEGFQVIIHPDCVCETIALDVKEENSDTEQITKELIQLLSLDNEKAVSR
ncbi:MAG: YkgJ family cysteine cluster protein [Candidatus Heimdallarchaeaceae archaeon]|jgi:Fe-S-cluster containining protein